MNTDNDPINLELMKHVERAVRPVVAPASRKTQVRRELLAHLNEMYVQELERQGSAQIAVARAVERFGHPADITRQLQGTVSRWDRWQARMGQWECRPLGQSIFSYALRRSVGVSLAAIILFLFFLVVMIGSRLAGHRDDPPFSLVTFFLCILAFPSLLMFFFTVLSQSLLHVIGGSHRRPGQWLAAAGLMALAGLVMFSGSAGLFLSMARTSAHWPRELGALWSFLLLGPVFLFLAARTHLRVRRRDAEWTELSLD